jgi:hypothetical protein
MSDLQLDQEERELLETYERDEWEPVPDQEAEIGRYRAYAEATFKRIVGLTFVSPAKT